MLKGLFVYDIIDREPEVLEARANMQTIIDRVLESDHTEFFVKNERGELEGTIYLREFTRSLAEQEALMQVVVAEDLLESSQPTVTENTDLGIVSQIFSSGHYEEIAVVDQDSPHTLVGSVHKRDVIHAYNQELLRRDLAGSVSTTVLAAGTGQQVDLGGGYVLQQILPPSRFFTRTIRRARPRRRDRRPHRADPQAQPDRRPPEHPRADRQRRDRRRRQARRVGHQVGRREPRRDLGARGEAPGRDRERQHHEILHQGLDPERAREEDAEAAAVLDRHAAHQRRDDDAHQQDVDRDGARRRRAGRSRSSRPRPVASSTKGSVYATSRSPHAGSSR